LINLSGLFTYSAKSRDFLGSNPSRLWSQQGSEQTSEAGTFSIHRTDKSTVNPSVASVPVRCLTDYPNR